MSTTVAERPLPASLPAAYPACKFRIAAQNAALGAVVDGSDIRSTPTGAQVHALKNALRDHHILIFRGQQPDDEAFLQFSSYFGTVFAPPRNAPVLGSDPYGAAPDIVLVSNVEDGLLGNAELTAHADHHWTAAVFRLAALRAGDPGRRRRHHLAQPGQCLRGSAR